MDRITSGGRLGPVLLSFSAPLMSAGTNLGGPALRTLTYKTDSFAIQIRRR